MVRELSLGERMKMELIAALLHRPRVLFLDEPTIGLDVVSQKAVRQFLRDYNRRYRVTILLTSHYMADIKELCLRWRAGATGDQRGRAKEDYHLRAGNDRRRKLEWRIPGELAIASCEHDGSDGGRQIHAPRARRSGGGRIAGDP
jgi:ABC-2 type transport system ATP-binding protein